MRSNPASHVRTAAHTDSTAGAMRVVRLVDQDAAWLGRRLYCGVARSDRNAARVEHCADRYRWVCARRGVAGTTRIIARFPRTGRPAGPPNRATSPVRRRRYWRTAPSERGPYPSVRATIPPRHEHDTSTRILGRSSHPPSVMPGRCARARRSPAVSCGRSSSVGSCG